MRKRKKDKALKPPEAAKLLEVTKVTLDRWRWAGRGPAWHRVGPKLIRYWESEVKAYGKRHRGLSY